MNLQKLPDGAVEIREMIAELDKCLLMGFVSGQGGILESLSRVFAGTPLSQRLNESVAALDSQEFQDSHFVAIAAARSALQSSLYQLLHSQVKASLGRKIPEESSDFPKASLKLPILESVRHWLMEVAMTGFARLERGAVMDFLPTLNQMRNDERLMSITALLTGFVNELITGIPAKDSADVPLMRWADLWMAAMLGAVGIAEESQPTSISGDFYPMGIELRQHSHIANLIAYGILVLGKQGLWLRQSWSSYKVDAIRDDEIWLLFPQAQQYLEALAGGKFLIFKDMPMLPSGDLLWCVDNATTGKKVKLAEIAANTLAPNADFAMPAFPALQRHPLQLAEPIFRADYADLPLRGQIDPLNELGLLCWDAGSWFVKPLRGGKEAAAILKKPPKSSSFNILKERSGRLLRKGTHRANNN